MTHGYETHDSCSECGGERMTGSTYGSDSRGDYGNCINCRKVYVTEG